MFTLGRKFIMPMLSLALFSLGTGVFTTAQSVWLHSQKYSALSIGLLVTAYYLGYIYSAFSAGKLIARVSHIRAYASFAALICALMLLQGLHTNIYAWFVIRLLSGYCAAGLLIVIESWLLSKSANSIRGRLLALYMLVYYSSIAFSQFFLNFGLKDILMIFALSAICCSLSIVPLAASVVKQPGIDKHAVLNFKKLFRYSSSGVIGSFSSGLILGPIYGLLPIYVSDVYKTPGTIAVLMSSVIFGGMFFQVPLGRLSDGVDRRLVLLLVFLGFLLCALLSMFFHETFYASLGVFFILGGGAFVIYPISMAHACDVLDAKQMVSASQALILVNSIGLVLGPLICSVLIYYLDSRTGLMGYFSLVGLSMSLFFLWRLIVGEPLVDEDRSEFVPLVRSTSLTPELDPRIKG